MSEGPVLGAGQTDPGRPPPDFILPPPPGHVSDVEVQEHYDNFFEVRVGKGWVEFPVGQELS